MEHIKLYEKDGDQEYVVEFDFLGKDSIRYQNKVSVEKRVFKNLQLFTDNKSPGDDLFDRLNVSFGVMPVSVSLFPFLAVISNCLQGQDKDLNNDKLQLNDKDKQICLF